MPRSSTTNRIWGDVEQFDTGKAVVELSFYYLAFVVVAGFINAAIISQALILLGAHHEFHFAVLVGFGIPAIASLIVGFRAGANGAKGLNLQRGSIDKVPSLMNITEGLCVTMGIEMPRVLELREPQINIGAFSVGNTRAVLVVTTGALNSYSRLEFEAVIARELARVRSGQIFFEARVRALQKLVSPVMAFLIPKRQSPDLVAQLIAGDLAGVSITRYPPALISALEKMVKDPNIRRSNSNLRRRILAPYWVNPELEGASLAERIAVLKSY